MAKAKQQPKAAPNEATLSRFQSFKPERLHRRQLRNAPYNPRTISDEAKKKLQKKLKTRGLLNALIWNRTTGNLLGGHQRLACLDALEGHDNYLLDVDVVELDAKAEVEENIFLNNPQAQGEYVEDLLAELLKMPDLELESTGFDLADVQVMFNDPELATLFVPNEKSAASLDEVAKQQEAAKTKARLQKERAQDKPVYDEREETETYLVFVFRTREERAACAGTLGYTEDDKYLDGARLVGKLNAGMLPTTGKPSPAPAASPGDGGDTPAAPAPKAGRSSRKVAGGRGPAPGETKPAAP